MKKINIAVIFGGQSVEHQVSLISAKNVMNAMDKNKYHIVPIGVTKTGRWFAFEKINDCFLNENNIAKIKININLGKKLLIDLNHQNPIKINDKNTKIDVAFPLIHGTFGEDGTLQGFLRTLHIPFVGARILGSAIGMDKDMQKRLLREAGIPVAKFMVINSEILNRVQDDTKLFREIKNRLGLPFFIKPANCGSSVGISKVDNQKKFIQAIKEAFKYDDKIIIEETIVGREIECAVLGNRNPISSIPGEIIAKHEFYDYEAKYLDEQGAILQIPAKLSKKSLTQIQKLAMKTFKTLECRGMARVDFFLKNNGEIIVNEINTIPGFTSASMYPKLWEATKLNYSQLIDRLIKLALR